VNGQSYQVDCLWLNRQIVELDGWRGHGTKSAFRDDRAPRLLRLTRAGWAQLA